VASDVGWLNGERVRSARLGPWRTLVAAVLAVAFVAVACGWPATSVAASVTITAEPAGSTTAAPTSAPTALASHVANPTDAATTSRPDATGPTDSTPSSFDEQFPNRNEAVLLAHVDPDLRDGCARADQFYADEIDSVSCGGDDQPFVDYTLFASVAELRAAFNDDVAQSESQPTTSGTCASANYQSTYTLGGEIAGRIQCTTRTANGQLFRVIEWTREELRILAYLSSATATWTEMIAFWRQEAGPIE